MYELNHHWADLQFHMEKLLSVKALESVRSAISISDAADPEHRLIYINPAFQILTGYGPDEVLGRNCRFLQAADRDQASRSTIRDALLNEQAVRVVLRNYRKDGSLFYNELYIDPIFGPDGAATYFVGCQNAIADPSIADLREAASLRRERLTEREREVFSMVANGYPNKLIARELGISPRTVEKHRISIMKKFEVADLTLLVRYAIALGIPFREPSGHYSSQV